MKIDRDGRLKTNACGGKYIDEYESCTCSQQWPEILLIPIIFIACLFTPIIGLHKMVTSRHFTCQNKLQTGVSCSEFAKRTDNPIEAIRFWINCKER